MATPRTDSQPLPELVRVLLTQDEARFFDSYRALSEDSRREIRAAMVTLTETLAAVKAGGTVDVDAIRAKHHPITAEIMIEAFTTQAEARKGELDVL